MIALPVKTQNEEGVVAPVFGHAKYFSLVDEKGTVTTHKNSSDGGVKVVKWLASLGVKTIILNHLGERPFHALNQHNIEIYFAGKERITVAQVLENLHNNTLDKVTIVNYMTLLGNDGHDHHDHGSEESCCSH